MTTVVIPCTCREDNEAQRVIPTCQVPGHGVTPPDPVDPQVLVDAGYEAMHYIDDAVQALIKARSAWVSRGLPASNPFPQSLDRLTETIEHNWQDLRKWVAAAATVAKRHQA